MTQQPVTPTLDIPLSEAVEGLTGFEVIAVEKHFGRTLADLGAVLLVIGVVWAYENRENKTDWSIVKARSLRELNGYFAPEPADPDDDTGKD